MKSLLTISGAALCAAMMAACVSSEPTEPDNQPSTNAPSGSDVAQVPAKIASDQLGDEDPFTITPRACFIEAFCHDARVNFRPSFCIHTGPCASGEALGLALTFCVNRCSSDTNCNNIVQLPACP
jgi:hypothetical protein